MALLRTSNNAVGSIDGGLSSSATTLTLNSIVGFPELTGDDFCILTLIRESDGALEYVRCITQDIGARSYEIIRGQEGTSPLVFLEGDEVRNLLTEEQINYLRDLLDPDSYVLTAGNSSNPMTGDLYLNNDLYLDNTSIYGARIIELGTEGIDQGSLIDFHSSSDPSQADHSARMIRGAGVDGNFTISSLGAGNIVISPDAGKVNMSGVVVSNVGTPVSGTDVANKEYVDTTVSGGLVLHAWAMWRESGSSVVEIDSENTSSITRNGNGDYYMNFPTAGNTNYLVQLTCSSTTSVRNQANEYWDQRTNSRIRVEVHDTGSSPSNRIDGVVTAFIYKRS